MAGNAVSSLMQSTAVNVNAVRLTSANNQKSPEVTAEFAPHLLGLLTNRPVVVLGCSCRSLKRAVSPVLRRRFPAVLIDSVTNW